MQNLPKHILTNRYYSVTRTPMRTEIYYHDLPLEHIGISINNEEYTLPTREQEKGVLVHINQYTSLHELIGDISSTYLESQHQQNNYGVSWILCEHLGLLNRLAVEWTWFANHAIGTYTHGNSVTLTSAPSIYGLVPGTRWVIVDPSKIYGVGILCHDPRLQVAIDTYPRLMSILQKHNFVEMEVPNNLTPSHFAVQRIYEWNGRFMQSDTQNKAVIQTVNQGELYEKYINAFITPP